MGRKKSYDRVYLRDTCLAVAWTYGRRKAREKARWDAYYRVNNVYTRQTAVDEINGLSDTISVPVLFLLLPLLILLFLINTFFA